MRKISLFVLTLCCSLLATAEPVSKQAALYTASTYMLAKGKNVVSTPKSSRSKASGMEEEYYYVFNAGNDGGYVIVSGDDRVEPILGYVEQGSFDPENIPENMRSWLQLYADQIKFIIDNDIQPGDPRIQKRNKVSGTKHSVPELMKSRWNQGKPYNITCPDYYKEGQSSLTLTHYPATGCAATALAQVINYYKFPDKTKAQIPSYSKTYKSKDGSKQQTVTFSAIPKNSKIDWDNMQDTYSWEDGHVANAQDSAVANLMHYCGIALKMGYGASSGADTSKSRDALVNYFGFDSRAFWANRPDYTIDDWFDMLYDEMEAGYPVLYRGHSSGGGHAFVIDGFDGDNLFHVNWGWGGGSNGWFLISILNPGDTSGMGASSSSDGYSMTQGGVFNLRLPDTEMPQEELCLDISEVTISGSYIKAKFTNKTGAKNSFHTGIVMLDENGEYALVGTRQTVSGIANGSSSTKSFQIARKLPEGTYRLSPASKHTKSETWHVKYNMRSQYIEAVVDTAGTVDLHFPYPTYEDIRIDTIAFPGTRIQKTEQEVKVTFHNYGSEYFKTVYLFASKTQSKVYTESKSMVAVRSGETLDVSYFFKPDTTGIYNLWLCTDDKGNNVIGETTMEVIPDSLATKANLAVSQYNISNAPNNGSTAFGKRLIGTATIKNNDSEDFHGKVKLQLWNQKVGSNTAYSGPSRTYSVDILAGKTASIDFDFDNLNEGYYYRFKVMYTTQDGTLSNGGLWDHRWEMKAGLLLWKADGTVEGKSYTTTVTAGSTTAGFYANCGKITRLTVNRTNPNAIYAFAAGMDKPKSNKEFNSVYGSHSDRIDLVNDEPYYIPLSFDADTALFTYTFPETENGTKWHAFTMPFEPDSILVDSIPVSLNDSLNHFWIYEFAAEGNYGEVIFAPAKVLRSGTPYIIAADSTMAGRSIVFSSLNVPFFKTGTDKMLVTSPSYKFHGNTLSPKLKNCYILNEEGTAFEYTTTQLILGAMSSYFTTNLPDSLAPASIVLPDIPTPPIKEITLDEMAENTIEADTYDMLTLKSTFNAGMNTICLPFKIEDVEAVFGQDAQAYEFYSFTDNELNFVKVDTLAAGQPYIIVLPADFNEDIVLNDITIDEASTQAQSIEKTGASLCGTYSRILRGIFETDFYGLTAEGTIVKLEEYLTDTVPVLVKGFHAYFVLDTEDEVTICLYDDSTGINEVKSVNGGAIYDLSGRQVSNGKLPRGIYIINGKKILK